MALSSFAFSICITLSLGFDVAKSGDGRVALIGFPSVGKSTMLSQLTETESETSAVEFTTLTCIPGNLIYNDVRIQVRRSSS